MSTVHRFYAAHMHAICRNLFLASGAPGHTADVVAEILVNSNLAGHDSHGVLRLPRYLEGIESGGIVPDAEPEVVKETGGTLLVDGHSGLGIHTARFSIDLAIEKAKSAGVSFTSFLRVGHIGRLGEYAEIAARAGCIGIITVGVGTGGRVAPYGAAAGPLGTNPIAVGVPTGDETPFILDYATTIVAEGKLQVARSHQADLSGEYLLDLQGKPSRRPQDFYDGGHLLTFGEHKGSALALLTCLLSGLSGHSEVEDGVLRGAYMQVMNIEVFTPLVSYQRGVRAFLDTIKGLPPRSGHSEVLVPGDFERLNRMKHLADGFELPDSIYRGIKSWADKLGVSLSEDTVERADVERYGG